MRVAIIGGGIGGLTTALLLSQKGINVTIYEKSDKLGGRLAFEGNDEFRIDQGPTIVLLPDMIKTILSEGGISPSAYKLLKCDPLYKIHFSDGSTYTKYSDRLKQEKEIAKMFPEDVEGFNQFITDMKTRFQLGKIHFLEKPFLSFQEFWNYRTIMLLAKLKTYRSVYKELSTYFTNEKLRISYALQTLYIGGNPFTTPAIYSLVSFSEHDHGIYYLQGGYASLVAVLVEELRKRKVNIYTSCHVEQIISSGNKAEYLVVNGRKEIYDSYIINGDFPVEQKKLLNRERSFTPSSACLLIYLGLSKTFEPSSLHQFFIGDDFARSMKEIFEEETIPHSPSFYTFYPSAIDSTLAPLGKSVLYTLVPVPAGDHIDWDIEASKLVDRIIEKMNHKGFPGIRAHIEWSKVRTPADAMREGLYKGGSFGIAPTLFQSGMYRPQVKPFHEKNIFAVGASIHPGGGIPIVMQGAKLLVDYICDEMNEKIGKEVKSVDNY
ncbi:phytoene desaturase family protein [Robertmurraya sp. P23]|uniref:phytoene desaturase family protein n=1 Tax=Robertmurraya sp. P23 TaxID=3436931 RepID=UPI003D981F24